MQANSEAVGRGALLATYAQLPFTVARGEGVSIYDVAGREYLDLYGGHAVSILGHSPKRVIEQLNQAANTLFFYSNVAPFAAREKVAAGLLEFAGGAFGGVFFCNSGAEANENALKLAIQLSGRSRLVALNGSFHGRSLLAASVTDNAKWHQQLYDWQGEVVFIKPNFLPAFSEINHSTAAVIVEPIQSIAGVVVLTNDYLKALKARCDEVGALLIFDEVQTGLGRTGTPFVSHFSGITPNMMTLAKGLGSGFPVGALLVSLDIAQQVKTGDLGSTFGGGPMACAAVQGTLDSLQSDNICQNVQRVSESIQASIQNPLIEEIRGRGLLIGLRVRNLPGIEKPAEWLQSQLLSRGIITGTSGNKQVLRLLPPLIIQPRHITQLAEALEEISRTAPTN